MIPAGKAADIWDRTQYLQCPFKRTGRGFSLSGVLTHLAVKLGQFRKPDVITDADTHLTEC